MSSCPHCGTHLEDACRLGDGGNRSIIAVRQSTAKRRCGTQLRIFILCPRRSIGTITQHVSNYAALLKGLSCTFGGGVLHNYDMTILTVDGCGSAQPYGSCGAGCRSPALCTCCLPPVPLLLFLFGFCVCRYSFLIFRTFFEMSVLLDLIDFLPSRRFASLVTVTAAVQ